MRVLVTGATGTVGGEVVDALRTADGIELRAVTRDASAAQLPDGVEVVQADLTVEADAARVLAGVDRVFLNLADDDGAAFFAALHDVTLDHVVLLSSFTAGLALPSGDDNIVRARHLGGETALTEAGVRFTALRAAGFDYNILMWLDGAQDGVVRAPTVDARLPKVDPRDIAASAAAVLRDPDAAPATFTITGPDKISTREEVAVIADLIGRPLEVRELGQQQAAALGFPEGTPEIVSRSVLETLGEDAGALEPTDDVERLTHRPARTFREWARDHQQAFAGLVH